MTPVKLYRLQRASSVTGVITHKPVSKVTMTLRDAVRQGLACGMLPVNTDPDIFL